MHKEYWEDLHREAMGNINRMLSECGCELDDIIEDGKGIDSLRDAKLILSKLKKRTETYEEEACAELAVVQALLSYHELHEHLPAAGAAA